MSSSIVAIGGLPDLAAVDAGPPDRRTKDEYANPNGSVLFKKLPEP
jgi:hypothetical protein